MFNNYSTSDCNWYLSSAGRSATSGLRSKVNSLYVICGLWVQTNVVRLFAVVDLLSVSTTIYVLKSGSCTICVVTTSNSYICLSILVARIFRLTRIAARGRAPLPWQNRSAPLVLRSCPSRRHTTYSADGVRPFAERGPQCCGVQPAWAESGRTSPHDVRGACAVDVT